MEYDLYIALGLACVAGGAIVGALVGLVRLARNGEGRG